MQFEQLPSRLLENAVSELAKLPGVGRKTALRLALHLLRQDRSLSGALGESIIKMREEITYCKICNNISDTEVCSICANPSRRHNTICVVEDIRDLLAIERTGQYHGVYHILNGLISPLDGIGIEDIHIAGLGERIENQEIKEIILALAATVEGDTTAFYIYRNLGKEHIEFSTISRGISIGDDLEYIDEITLGRSISDRIPYHEQVKAH